MRGEKCLLLTAYCLLITDYCLLLTAYCLLLTDMSSSRDQFNKQAALYAASPVHRFGPSLTVLVEMAAADPADLVLDIATGTGNTARTLAPLVRRVIGLDVAQAMLDQARSRAEAESVENVEFVSGSAEEVPFPDIEFSCFLGGSGASPYQSPLTSHL
jgi:SAM-dependent methyltransferase